MKSILLLSSLFFLILQPAHAQIHPGNLGPDNLSPCTQYLKKAHFTPLDDPISLEDISFIYWLYDVTNIAQHEDLIKEMKTAPEWEWKIIENQRKALRTITFSSEDSLVIAFRGTDSWQNVLADLTFEKVDTTITGMPGEIHKGFWHLLESKWPSLQNEILKARQSDKSIWFTGHSMGGALATLAAARSTTLGISNISLITWASPRVGNKEFTHYLNSKLSTRHIRMVLQDDIIPRLPPPPDAVTDFIQFFNPSLRPLIKWTLHLKKGYFSHAGALQKLSLQGNLEHLPHYTDRDDSLYWQKLSNTAQESSHSQRIEIGKKIWKQHWPYYYSCALKKAREKSL